MDAAWAGIVDASEPGPSPLDPLLGSVLVRDVDLPGALGSDARLRVVSSGGAGALAGPLRLAARSGAPLAGLQTTVRDPDDPAGAARRVVAALDAAADEGLLPEETTVVVEVAPSYGLLGALDVLAERELVWGLPLLAGAAAEDVTGWLDAALDRETAYVVTRGVERAVTSPEGFGLVNLLVATRMAFDGAPAAPALAETDPAVLLASQGLPGARRWLRSVVAPVDRVRADLDALGLTSPRGRIG